MNSVAIKVENLSKRYRIGLKEEQHDTFLAATLAALRQPLQNLRRLRRLTSFDEKNSKSDIRNSNSDDIIWALKDVSFEVRQGEIVGIIGRNGAGKSTLLKILSRITHPTTGRVELNGRVSSLLEVGTGFHPELTGRDNIYLNGTILGMRKVEIDRKFDEIVAFSGVEKFIGTPVKRYSSGMRVRLAFSVAAHLEPEILLIDEVLAVGDVAFRRKCLGKMQSVAGEGRTVLFVSHQMDAIESLCQRAIYLMDGHIIKSGLSPDVISQYLQDTVERAQIIEIGQRIDRKGSGEYFFSKIWITNEHDKPFPIVQPGDLVNIYIEIKPQYANVPPMDVFCSLGFRDHRGNRLFTLSTELLGRHLHLDQTTKLCFTIEELQLPEGEYRCNVFLGQGTQHSVIDWIQDAFVFSVVAGDFFGTGKISKLAKDRFLVKHQLKIE